jgi:hypothetical protein
MNLKTYLIFSINYKKNVGNNLNNDLKMDIWNIYKKVVAFNFLKLQFSKIIFKCRDCEKIRWIKFFGTNVPSYYEVQACNREQYYFTDTMYCEKRICLYDCKFKIKCNKCSAIFFYTKSHNDNDIGWNPIESLKKINIKCVKCSNIIERKLIWNHTEHNDIVLGKLI